jgi:aminopeptidase N
MRYYFLLFITSFSFSQQYISVDFKSVFGKIAINQAEKSISGDVNYEFIINSPTDSITLDAQKMTFSNLKINNLEVNYKNSGKKLILFQGFILGKNTLSFHYEAQPKQTLYFVGNQENSQIWTQGQGKYTSHWFPSFDDTNEKLIFNLDIIFDKNFQVLSNGILANKVVNSNTITWQYRMKNPMSSYLLALVIGKYNQLKSVSKSGIPMELYYESDDEVKAKSTYYKSKEIFDFLEKEIGIRYPWEVYKQIPVRDFLYAGMENTSATIFSRDFVIDEIGFNDRNYLNVNAHELAHQWFGDFITAKNGNHHWLQEGFATYFALLAEKEILGDDYFNYKLYQNAQQIKTASKTDTIPILSDKASSLTYYQKGAWALHILRTKIGEKAFRKATKQYLKKYAFQNVDTDDFLSEVQKVSGFDLVSYRKKWLESPIFESDEANEILAKNDFIKIMNQIQKCKGKSFAEKKDFFEQVMISSVFYPAKEALLFQVEKVPFEEKRILINLALNTNDIYVRQAVAKTMSEIPDEFKASYFSLLNDESYITREIVLATIWSKFPDEQKDVLDKTKAWIGFNDKNLRILWLTLALQTKEYETGSKVNFYDELLGYASAKNESSVRQNAIESILYSNQNDKNILTDLVNALTSHKWQFSKFAREQIRLLLKNQAHRNYFENVFEKFSIFEQQQLRKLLEDK